MADDLARKAEELRQETAALNALLSGYASKTDVEKQLAAERTNTRRLIGQRNRWRTRALAVVAVAVLISFALIGINRDNACTFRSKHNLLVDKVEEAVTLVNANPRQRTDAEQEAVDRFVRDYVATIEVARVGSC